MDLPPERGESGFIRQTVAPGSANEGIRKAMAMWSAGSKFIHWANLFPTFLEVDAMSWKIRLAITIIASAVLGRALADEFVLEQMYGSGVHAFNDGDLAAASDAFTAAIKGGTNDPRPYYFRALTFIRLGREQDAKLDFEKGAELEAVDAANVTLVSRSLERVQGRQRQMLEQFRTVVRAAALARKQSSDRAVRQAIAQEEQSVRRKVQPLELPSNPDVSPSMSSSQQPSNNVREVNPFEPNSPAPRENVQPEVNQFDAPAKSMPKATPPVEDSPFGEAPAKGATKPADSDNPFSDAPASAPKGNRPTPGDNSAGGADKPAPGAIAGLFHAFVEGARPDEGTAPPPEGGPGMNISGMIHGMLGGGPPPDAGPPPAGQMPMPNPTGPTTQPPSTPTTPAPTQPAPKSNDNPFD
jgi:hypothetical protein